jgi:hypothetical protein
MRRTALSSLLLLVAFDLRAAEISELRVALAEDQVVVSFRLEDGFDDKLVERVESGLATTLIYELELRRDRKRWFDRNLEESSLTVVGIYDAVRREYLVNTKLDGRLLESRMVHDLEALKEAMTRFDRLPVFTLEPLPDDGRILVRVRAELGTAHLLGFIPSTVNTDWVDSNKLRPPDELVPSSPEPEP